MKLCIGSKIYDVQNDKAFGIVVYRGGKLVRSGTRAYDMAVSEFKRIAEDNAYAAREAALRSAA